MKNEKNLLSRPFPTCPEVVYRYRTSKKIKPAYGTEYTEDYYCIPYNAETIDDKTIAICIYGKNKEPLYRIFLSRYDLVSQRYDKADKEWKRSTGTISSYLDWRFFHRTDITDEQSEKIIKDFIKEHSDIRTSENTSPLELALTHCISIRKHQREKKNDKIRKSINDEMLCIKPIPEKQFNKWIDDVALKESRYILYTYTSKKKKKAYCTHCKSYIEVENIHHNTKVKCPNCHSVCIAIARGKAPSTISDRETVHYIQIDNDNMPVFRSFDVRREFYFCGDIYKFSDTVSEFNREFYSSNRNYVYRNGNRGCEWYLDYSRVQSGYIYPYNIKKVFSKIQPQKKYLSYIPYTSLLKNEKFYPKRFYIGTMKYPIIEYLAKLKLNKLVTDLRGNKFFNPEETNIKKIFPAGVNKKDLLTWKKVDIRADELQLYYEIRDTRNFKDFEEIFEYNRKIGNRDSLAKILKHTTIYKIKKYVKEQTDRHNEGQTSAWTQRSEGYTLSDWQDYISFAKVLKWNLKDDFILFPKSLDEAHDRADSLCQVENRKAYDIAIKDMEDEINELYGYESGSYLIRAPHSGAEIVEEGQKMHHCVGGYVIKVAKAETNILFMRSKESPNKPLYTIEVQEGELIQIRGQRNCDIKEKKEKQFFDRYKRVVLGAAQKKAV